MEPPDPGGTSPAYFVTISNSVSENESSMDTDGSVNKISRKRSRKICKLCNKKKRKHHNSSSDETITEIGCHCRESDSSNENTAKITNLNPNETKKLKENTIVVPPSPPQIGRKEYNNTDVAPYVIHVQRKESSPSDGSTLHPVTFGKFLQNNVFNNIINGSVKRIGRNRITLSFSNYIDANLFINSNCLNTCNLKAFIPSFNVTRMGLIRGVPAEWSEEEIKNNISVPIGCGEVIKIRRLNFKSIVDGKITWKPSQTVVLTFDGQILPKRIFMCYNALNVELYTYPTIQCFNCCRYGHTKVQCRSKPRCYKCGQNHTGDSCSVESDSASCCLCTGFHFATSQSCPELARQKAIKKSMAQDCISYAEASKFHPAVSKSYADVLVSAPTENNLKYKTLVQSPSTSYTKTVFKKPRIPSTPLKEYDRAAHAAIIKDCNCNNSTSSNGCALQNPHQTSVSDIILALLQSLSQANIISPSNVAPLIEMILQILKNGQNSSMELPKRD